jgi:hypothetical protein
VHRGYTSSYARCAILSGLKEKHNCDDDDDTNNNVNNVFISISSKIITDANMNRLYYWPIQKIGAVNYKANLILVLYYELLIVWHYRPFLRFQNVSDENLVDLLGCG